MKREKDEWLMKRFGRLSFTALELQQSNYCRLFLQVKTFSDITDGNGTCILKKVYDGIKESTQPKYHDWPEQTRPEDEPTWPRWRKVIKQCYSGKGIQTGDRWLPIPLGNWYHKFKSYQRWYFDPQSNKIYLQDNNNNGYTVYQHQTYTNQHYRQNSRSTFLPSTCIIA